MSREQAITGLIVLALLLAALGLGFSGGEWAARVYARALELYFGGMDERDSEIERLATASDKDLADYEALTRQYNKIAGENEDLQRLNANQAEMIRSLVTQIEELQREKEELRQMVIEARKRAAPE